MSQPAGAGQTRCRQCGKGIMWPGLCYTCATGLPRRLRRPAENLRELAEAGVGCAPSECAGRPPVRKEEAMSKKGGNKTKAPPKAPMANKGPKKK